MKGLVLCAGKGTRLRPLTYTTAKHLIPVANRPVIEYTLDFMKDAGVTEVAIVVSPENKELFKENLKDGAHLGISIEYIVQEQPKGIAHAVYQAKDFVKGDPFLLVLGDNLIFEDIRPAVEQFSEVQADALILLAHVEDPRAYGVAVLENDRIKYVVEKPKDPPSDLAIVGVYMFRKDIFKAIENIKPSWRGELEITDAIGYLVQNNYSVMAHVITGWWKDTGKPEDLLEANRKILDNMKQTVVLGSLEKNSSIQGRVRIGKGTIIAGSVIRGPAVIGENCRVINSYVGPYTAIGNGVSLEDCEIENSILMDLSNVANVTSRIDSSILGKGARVIQNGGVPKVARLVVGDLSFIQF